MNLSALQGFDQNLALVLHMNLSLITFVFRSGFCSVIGSRGLCSSWEVVGTTRLCDPYSSCHC